ELLHEAGLIRKVGLEVQLERLVGDRSELAELREVEGILAEPGMDLGLGDALEARREASRARGGAGEDRCGDGRRRRRRRRVRPPWVRAGSIRTVSGVCPCGNASSPASRPSALARTRPRAGAAFRTPTSSKPLSSILR